MTRLTRSQPVALLGEAPPRVLVKPRGVRANSWQDVADLSVAFGISLDDWQELILEAAMGERSDATWAAKRVGISVPRQNGKSQLLVARALAGALLFGEKKIVVSAHQQDTARESFAKLMEIVEADGNESLRCRLDPKFGRGGVMNALNREAVRFSNGATIQFKARSGAAGKGFSSDCLLLDEAQILGSRAWTSINSTMSAMRNPQVWLLGTPPQDEDDSYTFDMVRKAAVDGKSTAAAWCEWAADPNDPDFDPASEYTRWQANPAWNSRINHEVVQGEFETYSPDRFAQDRLGIWRVDKGLDAVVPAAIWRERITSVLPNLDEPPVALGLDRWHDGTTVVAGSWRTDEDQTYLELLAVDPNGDAARTVDWVAEKATRRMPVLIAADSPAASLAADLIARRVNVVLVNGPDFARSCQAFVDDAVSGSLAHSDQSQLNEALAGAVRLSVGKAGAWVWDRRSPDHDISSLVAATLARFGAANARRRTGRGRSGQRGREATVG